MSLTGFGLVGFLITHLIGNANLYRSGSDPFNTYAAKLHSLGPILEVAEIGLLGMFVLHIVTALQLKFRSRNARQDRYAVNASKKGPSKSGFISQNMALSGLLILAFVVLHVKQLHFGPGMDAGYVTNVTGESTRDIHRLVVETFSDPLNVALYVAAMIVLGLHLRHGFWSAFQSLGLTCERSSKALYIASGLLAALIAGGFLFMPIWIYFGVQS